MTTSREIAAISETAFAVMEKNGIEEGRLHAIVAELTHEIRMALASAKYESITPD